MSFVSPSFCPLLLLLLSCTCGSLASVDLGRAAAGEAERWVGDVEVTERRGWNFARYSERGEVSQEKLNEVDDDDSLALPPPRKHTSSSSCTFSECVVEEMDRTEAWEYNLETEAAGRAFFRY